MMKEPSSTPKTKKGNPILRLLALLVTLALMLAALALVVHRDRLNLDALERWLNYRKLETLETGEVEPFTHAGGDQLSLARLDKGILFSSASGAHYYSLSGEVYAEEVLSMDHPVLSSSDQAGVVYDAGGQSLFLFQEGTETFDLALEGNSDLLSARVNDAGWLAVTAQQSGYKGAVTVYNNKGEKIIQISLSSTFAVDAALSPDGKTVAVVTIDQSAGRFRSQILFYPINRTEPSATVDLGDLLVLDLDFESEQLWLLTDDQVLTLSPDGKELGRWSFAQSYLKGCNLKGDGFACLLLGNYETGGADRILTLSPSCQPLGQMQLTGQVLDFDCAGTYASLLTGTDLTIYNSALIPYAQLEDPQGARYTCIRDDGSAVLADHQRCWLFIPD